MLGDGALPVIHKVAIGQMNNLLGEITLPVQWQNDPVGDDIINEVRPHRAGKP
jgi:hypothetical protein